MATTPSHGGHEAHGENIADLVLDRDFWEQRYRSHPTVWSGNPNAHLVSEAADLTPGTALDVGAGEGADALWLAQRGWQVTAADISTVALDRGASHAAAAGPDVAARIEWLQADLTTWDPKPLTYDLVSAQFMQPPLAQRASIFGRLAASVAPSGSLLIVGHHASDLDTTVPRPPIAELYFTAADIADLLAPDEWDILVSDVRARDVTDPDGHAATIHDAVLHARRKGPSTW